MDWEWFADAETLQLFLYLLLTANYEDRKWKDITIQRGQLVTSLSGLASSLNMSVKKIRVRLNRLADSGTIITEWTNKYSVITICNYDSYQDGGDTEGQAKGRQDEPKWAGEKADKKDTSTDCEFDSYNQYDSDQGQAEWQAKGRQGDTKRAQTKEYKNKEYISTSTARACEEEASEAESESEVDKLTASGRERAKNRLRIGDSESNFIGQGEVATIRNWWNLEVANERIRKVNAVTGSRKTLLAQRVKEWTLYAYDNGIAQPTMSWQATLAKIATIIRDSPYLQGKTPRAQPLTFDRLIGNDTFWLKILEGQYTDVAPTTTSSTTITTTNGRNYTTAGETTRRTDLSDGKRDYSVESLQRFLNR